jgi:hypothetical protein
MCSFLLGRFLLTGDVLLRAIPLLTNAPAFQPYISDTRVDMSSLSPGIMLRTDSGHDDSYSI